MTEVTIEDTMEIPQEQHYDQTDQVDSAPALDDATLQAAMDEVDKSTFAIVKQIFVILKTSFLVFQTLKAANAWRKSKTAMAKPALFLLLANAALVIGVLFYKFSSKKIAPLFVLQGLSHYSAFCVLHVLVGYSECKAFEEMRGKFSQAFLLMHCIFWCIFGLGFSNTECTQKTFYPDGFMLTNSFFFGVYLMVKTLHTKGYLMEWTAEEKKAQELFEAQTDRFMGFFTFLVEWHLFELVIAKVLDVFTDSIHCSEDGTKWFYSSGKGNLFMMLHIIGTMMSTGMTRAVFIKTAKKLDFFGGLDDDESEAEDSKKDSKKKK